MRSTRARMSSTTHEFDLESARADVSREVNMVRMVRLFLCGDVMIGRGIDQVLRHPGDPHLFEPAAASALDYVALAERRSGLIPLRTDDAYLWGHALAELERTDPDVRIANLETAVTASGHPWEGKAVHYRMHPRNVGCLEAIGFDCCGLANNHVLDWGEPGLVETLEVLESRGISSVGAGTTIEEAMAPAVLEHRQSGRVLVFAFGLTSSGIPAAWVGGPSRPGIRLLEDLSASTARALAREIRALRLDRDLVVASVHWGPNWGYGIPDSHRSFAHRLIDHGAIDVLHGHSSHHAMGIEVYRDRPILYGSGDFLNDYEGIRGHERFRPDLPLMYFPVFDPEDGALVEFSITPLRIRRFRLESASEEDRRWVRETLDREGRSLGTHVETRQDGSLALHWETS